MTEETKTTKITDVLERTVCGRCGGSGHYSYNQRDGTRCYGCGGTGRKYTKRGAAALAFYRTLTTTEYRWVRPGDRIFTSQGWGKVEEISDNRVEKRSGRILEADDPKVEAHRAAGDTVEPYNGGRILVSSGINVKTARCTMVGNPADAEVRVALDPAVKVCACQLTAEYQASLTKQGRPRKGSRWDKGGSNE